MEKENEKMRNEGRAAAAAAVMAALNHILKYGK
jgi:hypothetical protein